MKRQAITGLALSLAFGSGLFGFSENAGTPQTGDNNQITVRIHNYARVPSSVLRQAEQAASSVLREAGVNAAWVDCPTVPSSNIEAACSRPVTPLVLLLDLLPESMARHFDFQNDAFGVAIESSETDFGFVGSIFYDKVKDCAVHERIDLAPFLGGVMAHELGHLLLGTHSHSRAGLMRASWSSKQVHAVEQRGLVFDRSEARQIQKAVLARCIAASHEIATPHASPIAATLGGLLDPAGREWAQIPD